MDPRDSNRGTRKKSKWVQELIKEESIQPQEVDHVVGRDQSAVMSAKSTTDASSVPETKTSVTNAQSSRKEEEAIAMEAEFADALKKIQAGIEDNQKKQLNVLNQIFTKAKEVIDGDKVKIATLEADNRYYSRLSDDNEALKKQLKIYKRLFYGIIASLTALLIIFLLLT